jgi:hypothetical protein
MTDEQKNYYLAMIGGKTQVDALQKILDGVGDEYEDLKGKIVDSKDALNTMADAMNDNSKGGIAQLKSALEEAGIAIYETLKPAIGWLTEKLQEAVNWFNGLSDSTKRNIVIFGAIALGIGGLLLVVGALLPMIASAISIFTALSAAGITFGAVMTFINGTMLPIIGVIALVVAAVVALKLAWDNNFGGIRDKTQAVIEFAKAKIESIKSTFESVKQKCAEFAEGIKNAWNGIKSFLSNSPIKATADLVKNIVTKETTSNNGQKSAWGTKRVVGNDVPYRLHDGERVLTRTEADRYDKGLGSQGVNITINGLTVREEADITKIANKLVQKINQNKMVYAGGAY